MRFSLGVVIVLVATASMTFAQETLDFPIGQLESYRHDSGPVANRMNSAQPRQSHVVRRPGAAWLRLHFKDVQLEKGSRLVVTSLLDGETQILDSAAMSLWGQTSAYFNGDAVTIDLIADAGTTANRYAIFQLERQIADPMPRGSQGQCGICGETDDRVPSSETWTGRLLPAGCTASVWNEDSCLVSAGHCIFGNMVIQFNVPSSQPNCGILHPPIADQFPVTSLASSNGGVGNDWAVMSSGSNNLGQMPFERFANLRPIATSPAAMGQTAEMTGYGVDTTCTRSQTQQFATGPIQGVSNNSFTYQIDLRGGNSGSSLIRDGEIIGIATHCPCPNIATRIDLPAFITARMTTCSGFVQPPNDACANSIPFNNGLGDGVIFYSTLAATTDGPRNPILFPVCNDAGAAQTGCDIWFTYQAGCTGNLTVTTCNDLHGAGEATYDTDLVVYGPYNQADQINCTNSVLNGKRIGCNDDDANHPCGAIPTRASTVVAPVTGGKYYLLRVGGRDEAIAGDGFLSVSCAPFTGACCLSDGSCQVLAEASCTGTYQGNGTACTPNPCPQPCVLLGDVNQDTSVDGADVAGFLRAQLGLPAEPGEMQDCANYETGTPEGDAAMFVEDLLEL